MQQNRRIVIVGAGYAGVLAAARVSRKLRAMAHEVVLVSPHDTLVERIRLHEAVASGRRIEHPLTELLAGSDVRLIRGAVNDVDPGARTVSVDGSPLAYDRLILALGSSTRTTGVPGVDRYAHTLDGAAVPELRRALQVCAQHDGRVVVCGGGLTGIEVAAELAEAQPGLSVTLLASGSVGPALSPRGRAHVQRALTRLGVALRERTKVLTVDERELATDRGLLPFDVCIWTAGFKGSELLTRAGFATDAHGRAHVDEHLRPHGHHDIYVIGDACRASHAGNAVPMGCKTALPMAACAADHAVAEWVGASPRPFVFRDTALCVSLGRRDGLLQPLTAYGEPASHVIGGKVAAWTKELICRFTVWRIAAESRFSRVWQLRTASGPARLPPAVAR